MRRTSIDECTYDVDDPNILAIAEATARGTNTVFESWLSPADRVEVREAKILLSKLDEKSRYIPLSENEQMMMETIEHRFRDLGITCQLSSIRTGNRGAFPWIDDLLTKADEHPEKQFAATVSFLINPHLDRVAREKLVAAYDDEVVARTELYAERPMGRGNWFSPGVIAGCESAQLSAKMALGLTNEVSGYIMERYGSHLIHWQLPRDSSCFYVLGGDAGTGMVPFRDSWIVLVFAVNLDERTAHLAGLQWGNTSQRQRGSWNPFIQALEGMVKHFNISAQNTILQVGGPESGIAETLWGAKRIVSTVRINETTKGQMANYTRQLMSYRFLQWPKEAADLSIQSSDWSFNDHKLNQDLVMALFAASWIMFQYFHQFIPVEDGHDGLNYQPKHYYQNRERFRARRSKIA